MSVIFLLIPLSIVAAAGFLGAFIWAVRSGQYEDTCTPSMRLLVDERGASSRPVASVTSVDAPRPPGSHPDERLATDD